MIIVKIVAAVISLIAVMYMMGLLPVSLMKISSNKISNALIYGFVMLLALLEIVGIPIVLLMDYSGYHVFVTVFSIAILIFSALGVYFGRKDIFKPEAPISFKSYSLESKVYLFVLLGCIAFQVVMCFLLASMDADDFYYNAQALQAQDYDVLYRIDVNTGRSTSLDIRHALALFPILEAYISSVFDIHVVMLAHKVMPIVLIPLSYLLVFKISEKLFPQKKELQLIFTILINVWRVFGFVSYFTTETFFLLRTWQGKSVAGNFIIPAIIYIFLLMHENKDTVSKGLLMLLAALIIASGASSSLAVMLSCGLIVLLALLFSILERRFKTALLEILCCIPGALYILLYVISG